MQLDFHYYATYAAASIAGYSPQESLRIAYSAQFVDCCSRTMLVKVNGPSSAATTQLQLELMNASTDPIGLQDITRIWSSFHFLPGDLQADRPGATKRYKNKYRLICNPNGALLKDTVELAGDKGLEACGLAMHVLADTWAHRYFAGTPSLVINNTNYDFYEIISGQDSQDGDAQDAKTTSPKETERLIKFNHNPSSTDDPEEGLYTSSLYQGEEHSAMNLGHGRAGHLPDYSYAKYRYMPAWAEYKEVVKDNPSDYIHAFAQMVYALKWLRNPAEEFLTETYAWDEIEPYRERLDKIIRTRRLDASDDWKALGEEISGAEIPDFDVEAYEKEYVEADEASKDDTFLGRFILAALSQKSMVTNRIYTSGSMLAGLSIDFTKEGFRGIRDFRKLMEVGHDEN